jgi:hypothetical protein
MVKVVAAALLFLASADIAHSATDRAALLPQVYRACQDYVLSEHAFAVMLGDNGISMRELCECQAPGFISRFSDAEAATLSRSWSFTAAGQQAFIDAAEICASGLKRRPRTG